MPINIYSEGNKENLNENVSTFSFIIQSWKNCTTTSLKYINSMPIARVDGSTLKPRTSVFLSAVRLYKRTVEIKTFCSAKNCGNLKPSFSSQWSLVQNFVRDFVCISFVWLNSLWEQSHTKLMQKKYRMKLRTRLHWLERLGFTLLQASRNILMLEICYTLQCVIGLLELWAISIFLYGNDLTKLWAWTSDSIVKSS